MESERQDDHQSFFSQSLQVQDRGLDCNLNDGLP